MEKRGVIEPGQTPAQDAQSPVEKQGSDRKSQIRELDKDFTKQAADVAAKKLKQ